MTTYSQKVIGYLRDKMIIKELDSAFFPDYHFILAMQNMLNMPLNKNYRVTEADAKLSYYEVVFNSKSELYFDEEKSDFNKVETDGQELLYVIIEEKLGLIETNSNRLWGELLIAQGLTGKDQKDKQIKEDYDFIVEGYQNLYEN